MLAAVVVAGAVLVGSPGRLLVGAQVGDVGLLARRARRLCSVTLLMLVTCFRVVDISS